MSLYFNEKKILHVDPGNRKPSLILLDRGRKIQKYVHIDTYYRKLELIAWR